MRMCSVNITFFSVLTPGGDGSEFQSDMVMGSEEHEVRKSPFLRKYKIILMYSLPQSFMGTDTCMYLLHN